MVGLILTQIPENFEELKILLKYHSEIKIKCNKVVDMRSVVNDLLKHTSKLPSKTIITIDLSRYTVTITRK